MKKFEEIWKELSSISLLGSKKSRVVYNLLAATENVVGDLAEIGVYKGATAKLIKSVLPQKHLHCYDTFCGIQNSDPEIDIHKNGEFSYELAKVKELVGTANVSYHIGVFPESFKENNTPFSFVHSDTDTYFGSKATLEYMFPRLSPGGVILFDDYRWKHCPGVERAVQEWLAKTDTTKIVFAIYPDQCSIVKLS